VQSHPEFKSRPLDAHPLFSGFVRAALEHRGGNNNNNRPERVESLA